MNIQKDYIEINNFDDLFNLICLKKDIVVKLSSNEIKKLKQEIYKFDFKKWAIDILWEYLWNDIEYDRMLFIFRNQKIISG